MALVWIGLGHLFVQKVTYEKDSSARRKPRSAGLRLLLQAKRGSCSLSRTDSGPVESVRAGERQFVTQRPMQGYGCGSKIGAQNGTLVHGNMD